MRGAFPSWKTLPETDESDLGMSGFAAAATRNRATSSLLARFAALGERVMTSMCMEYVMKHSAITSGLVGAFALTLSTVAALAQPGNFGSSQQPATSAESGPLLLVRGGGGGHGGGGGGHGGGFGGGGHGFHGGRGFRGGRGFGDGFGFYAAPYDDSCWWSRRYGRVVCY
jgi:hypothetical protein